MTREFTFAELWNEAQLLDEVEALIAAGVLEEVMLCHLLDSALPAPTPYRAVPPAAVQEQLPLGLAPRAEPT